MYCIGRVAGHGYTCTESSETRNKQETSKNSLKKVNKNKLENMKSELRERTRKTSSGGGSSKYEIPQRKREVHVVNILPQVKSHSIALL